MDDARLCAVRAQRSIASTALPDASAAVDVLHARSRLLTAIACHATTVLGPGMVQAWRDSAPTGRGPDPRTPMVRATLTWLDALDRQGTDNYAPTGIDPRNTHVATHLDRARTLVDAATDLVGTHRAIDGGLHPDASTTLATIDVPGLLAAAVRVAAIAGPVEPLALRCRQAGLSRSAIDSALPLSDPITVASWELAVVLRFPVSAVAPITLHGHGVDQTTPAREWTSRLERIETRLRALEARGRISVRTLHDIAALGLVTSHVLAATATTDPGTAQAGGWAARTDEWRRLADSLEPIRSTEPADRVIRHDVERLLTLAHPGTEMTPPARDGLLTAIRSGLPALDRCTLTADRLLSHTTDAWIPAKPRRPYLPDLHRPGQAARPATLAPSGFPRMGPALT
jgi:hypothetical protein